jgi:hypothetical protein
MGDESKEGTREAIAQKRAAQERAREKVATREERGATPGTKRASDTRHGVEPERK